MFVARRSQRYDDGFTAVRHVLNKWDPERLIETGAPGDEYDPEVTDLVRLVLGAAPVTGEAIEDVWRRWFGDDHGLREHVLAAVTDDLTFLQSRFNPPAKPD